MPSRKGDLPSVAAGYDLPIVKQVGQAEDWMRKAWRNKPDLKGKRMAKKKKKNAYGVDAFIENDLRVNKDINKIKNQDARAAKMKELDDQRNKWERENLKAGVVDFKNTLLNKKTYTDFYLKPSKRAANKIKNK